MFAKWNDADGRFVFSLKGGSGFVEISNAVHQDLLRGESRGMRIVPDGSGIPVLVSAPAPSVDSVAATVRSERAKLLSQCDWTALPDVPLSQSERTLWESYRQALRDITIQPGFPQSVVWPESP